MRLDVAGSCQRSLLEIRDRFIESLRFHRSSPRNKLGTNKPGFRRIAWRKRRWPVRLSRLVVHQAEVGFEFGDFRMDTDSLPIEFGGCLKITPGLGLLRRGQERFKFARVLAGKRAPQNPQHTTDNNNSPDYSHASPVQLESCLHQPRTHAPVMVPKCQLPKVFGL